MIYFLQISKNVNILFQELISKYFFMILRFHLQTRSYHLIILTPLNFF